MGKSARTHDSAPLNPAWFGRGAAVFLTALLIVLATSLTLGCGGASLTSEVLAPATPNLTSQPTPQTVTLGQSATFSVTTAGLAPFTYQWSKDGVPIPLATAAAYTTPAAAKADDGAMFAVSITNRLGQASSNPAALTVQWAPIITAQPGDQTVTEGQPASFTVAADAKPAAGYQWQKNLTDIPGATSATYLLGVATLADNGATYRCLVSNAVGTTASNAATLTVNQAPQPPTITGFTANPTTVTLGQNTTLSWVVSGATSLSIDHGVGSVTGLSSKQVTPGSTGTLTYTLTATNGAGSTQATAQVLVNPLPTYALTANLGAGTTGLPSSTTSYPQGSVVNYTYALLTGYQNLQVSLDGSPVAASGSVTMNGPHTLTTTAQVQTFTLTASAGANGTISPPGITTLNYGGSQTFTITPNAGFLVADVLADGASVGTPSTYTFTNVIANHTLSATFVAVPSYALSVNLGTGTTGTPAATASYVQGTVVPYNYTLQTGYQNLQVSLDGSPVATSGTVTMNGLHSLAATAQIQTNTLTASAGANGTISPAGLTTVNYGGSQTYTLTPSTGYQVASVLVDGVSVGSPTTYTFTNVTANHTISATFQILTFSLTASAGPNGAIAPAGVTTVNYGGSQAYTITPNAGYQVAGVTLDGVSLGALTTYTLSNVTADHMLVATFSLLPTYALTITLGLGATGTPNLTASHPQGTVVAYSYALQTGYQNLQVSLDGSAVAASGTVTMNGPHTLAAGAVIQTFTITASAGANGTISPTGGTTLNYGSNQTYTITPNAGYTVANVLVDGVSVGAVTTYTFTNLLANHTISATFTAPPPLNLTVIFSAGVTGTPSVTATYTLGTSVHYSYFLQAGYQNLQVTLDGVPVGTFGDVTMDAPHTLSVSAQVQTFTITASPGPNGTISPAGVTTVNFGASQAYTFTPNAGYQVANVIIDGASVGAVTTYTVNNVISNIIVSATFITAGPIIIGRSGHSATLLATGKTLVAGGSSSTPSPSDTPANALASTLASTLVYDAAAQSWVPSDSLGAERTNHTATRLQDGTVLVVGGAQGSTYLASAEIYDPTTASWSHTGRLGLARSGHSATLLPDGRVLVAGGLDAGGPLPAAEIYDPATRLWSPTDSLATARSGHSATLLVNGTVLVAGGLASTGAILQSELFDPKAGAWTPTSGSLAEARSSHTATLLQDGTLLVAGGIGNGGVLSSTERFDPRTGTWSLTKGLTTARTGHGATLLPSGVVLVSGGNDGAAALPSVEVFDPASGTWTLRGPLKAARSGHSATLQPDGSVLVAFGTKGDVITEIYMP